MEESTISDEKAENTGRRPKKGIPSEDHFYLPRKDSLNELLKKDSAIKSSTSWNMQDVLQFVFPEKYRKSYHSTATKFMQALKENGGRMSSPEIAEFVSANAVSKATFYNKVIPRLNRIGMIERNRSPSSNKLDISWSLEFSSYLEKIAFEWKRLEPQKK